MIGREIIRARRLGLVVLLTSSIGGLGCSGEQEKEVAFNAVQPAHISEEIETVETTPLKSSSEPINDSPVAELEVSMGPEFDGNSHALLVGCTTYDFLGEDARLRGPINDVKMMRDLLTGQFGFLDKNIHRLTEGRTKKDRPLKANIVRELTHLVDTVKNGDRVVLLLSGHGSQQPDNDPDNEDDPEPDGFDEIFCPADIDSPDDFRSPYAKNALTDDELRESIKKIRKKGAFVWVIIDACHSGTAIRGTEVYRQISPERLFPKEVLAKAKRNAKSSTRSVAMKDSFFGEDVDQGGLVAIYASQPHEPTLEMVLPDDSDDSDWRGLLTYTLIKILTSAETPLTYNELVQRIHSEYIHSYGRLGPTPLVEGVDQNHEVLGQTEMLSRSPLTLSVNEDGRFIINAGKLHGFSTGSVFAIHPPPGVKKVDTPLGHVQIVRSQLTESTVVPVSYDDIPVNADLPIGGKVELVEIRYGQLTLKIAVDDQTDESNDSKFATSVLTMLEEISGDPGKRIKVIKDPKLADWIVRCTSANKLFLLPAEGWSTPEEAAHFGPAPEEGQIDWLRNRLGRIARVKSLLQLCDASKRQSSGGLFSFLKKKKPCAIYLKMLSLSPETEEVTKVNWTKRSWTLTDGENVVLKIENSGSEAVDFSVLFIDSEYGITPMFPAFGVVADNRLQPGQSYTVGPMQVEASTVGLEHLVVIATKVQGQPIDFSWLGQESLEGAENTTRAGLNNHPLSRLFQDALYSKQNVRGMRMADAESTCMRATSWRTVKVEASE